jgi:hypothetical protein
MAGRLADELERILKTAFVASSRYYSKIFLERLKNIR